MPLPQILGLLDSYGHLGNAERKEQMKLSRAARSRNAAKYGSLRSRPKLGRKSK